MTSLPLVAFAVAGLGAGPLTEHRAVEIALAQSPGVKALALELEEARAQVDVAMKLENPEFHVSNLRSDRLLAPVDEENSDSPFSRLSVGVKWSPPNPWTRGAQREVAERKVDQAAEALELGRRSLSARVRTLHVTVRGLDAQIVLARSAVERRGELRTLVKRRLDQHAATVLDQSLADLDYLDTLASLRELESRRRQVFQDLFVQLGIDSEDEVELTSDEPLTCNPPHSDVAALLARAKANDPRLRAIEAQLAALEARRTQLSRAVLPSLDSFTLNAVTGTSTSPGYATLRVGLLLPVFDRNGPDLQALAFHRSRVEEEHRAEELLLGRGIRRVVEELSAQADLVRQYEQAEPMIARSASDLQVALDASEADLLQVALVQTRVLAAKRAQLRATLDCRTTQIELERLVGE